ncbi:hypothetical protein [Paraburkholderia sacchari]|uniref:hypothetical protein n=1 Tax=Paraburkholderia sacchari TaxID=159450 RepID=UPI001BCD19FC|nr:hypothetical protein [Paraburkholderia sacchari]
MAAVAGDAGYFIDLHWAGSRANGGAGHETDAGCTTQGGAQGENEQAAAAAQSNPTTQGRWQRHAGVVAISIERADRRANQCAMHIAGESGKIAGTSNKVYKKVIFPIYNLRVLVRGIKHACN